MGNVLSATSVYANAYLTNKGRGYLFNEQNDRYITEPSSGELIDLFEITHFSMSDPDVNYNLTSGVLLESGDVPDLAGENSNNIKATTLESEIHLISYDGDMSSDNTTDPNFTVEYSTDQPNNELIINLNDSSTPDPIEGGSISVNNGYSRP